MSELAIAVSPDPNQDQGMVKTDMHCHECNKTFVARIDYSIDGNHIVECPTCGHHHCRVITNGTITSDRWDSRYGKIEVAKRNVWKHNDLPIITSSASQFLLDKWLNFGG